MSCKIVQFNMNHCWGAHDLLQQFMTEERITAIMEPIYIPENNNWICNKNKKTAIFWKTKYLKAMTKAM